jgi:hypothetical protein
MTYIIIILTIEFAVLISFALLIYKIVKKDMKQYERREHLPL